MPEGWKVRLADMEARAAMSRYQRVAVDERFIPLEKKQKQLEHILGQVASGRSVNKVLKEDGEMPSACTFWRWHFQDVELQNKLARARETGVEAILAEVIDIADEDNGDAVIEYDKDGQPYATIDGQTVQRSKLRAEMRLKYAQMIAPRKYGAKLDVTSGGEKLPAPTHQIDARVQSIVMQAAARMAKGEPLVELDEEAQRLLE